MSKPSKTHTDQFLREANHGKDDPTPPGEPGEVTLRPKYVQLSRAQQRDLDDVARTLMDLRTRTGGQRITANTLIRVAIDALLAQRRTLAGDDERELRENYFKTIGIQDTGTA